jgi:plasmid replication initiation protein
VKNLRDKSVWITLDDGRETVVSWIERPYINKKNGTIQIKLDELMKPYLLQLKKRFTSYSLYFTLAMQSKYSIRLYELLKSYQNLGQCEFEIDRLKSILAAEKYELFANLKQKVLNISLREINDYGDILVSYELEKQGRKFHKIKFTIQPKYAMDIDESIRTWKSIEKILNN